jgi:hypothetical protein
MTSVSTTKLENNKMTQRSQELVMPQVMVLTVAAPDESTHLNEPGGEQESEQAKPRSGRIECDWINGGWVARAFALARTQTSRKRIKRRIVPLVTELTTC